MTLLQHFRSYLESDAKGKAGSSESPEEKLSARRAQAPVYVKKWMRTRHAIMFRLSNKVVQVIFQDNTEIILSSETREVTYVNKKGERATYQLTSALESTNLEMAKRLKYTKDILTHLLSSSQPHAGHVGTESCALKNLDGKKGTTATEKPAATGEKAMMAKTARGAGGFKGDI